MDISRAELVPETSIKEHTSKIHYDPLSLSYVYVCFWVALYIYIV